MLKLYSLRWSTGKGHHWTYERDLTIETQHEWLKIFENDEPDVPFKIAKRKPLLTKLQKDR